MVSDDPNILCVELSGVEVNDLAEPPGAAAVRHHGDQIVEGTWQEKLVLPTKQI